ncbi:MAG: hypothetical protein ACHQD9_06580, partial [Chitinophagales bacterium]
MKFLSIRAYGFCHCAISLLHLCLRRYLQVQNKGKIKNLIIGDFQNQFGQGLTLGGAFAMGKG